jgi:hypothetical protein
MFEECSPRRDRERTSRTNSHDSVRRTDDVAGSADEQQMNRIRNDHHRFQSSEQSIGAPILG